MESQSSEPIEEAILEPALPIIDAHHHLFERNGLRYLFEEYLSDTRAGHQIEASVYVEASAFLRENGPEVLRPLGEIEFASGVGAMCASGAFGQVRLCAAIVGYADLRLGSSVGWLLDRARAAAPERFRGIRQITMEHPSDLPFQYFSTGRPPQGIIHHPKFHEGFAELARRGLSYEATGFHLQLPDNTLLADAFPDTPIIVNHMTIAMGLEMTATERAALFEDWRNGLREIAQRPNVLCKIGGLGMPIWGFGFENRQEPASSKALAKAWRPFVETAIEIFGPERCMMESNFPPDSRSGSYVTIWNALKRITANYSADEKLAMYRDTAARVYRISDL